MFKSGNGYLSARENYKYISRPYVYGGPRHTGIIVVRKLMSRWVSGATPRMQQDSHGVMGCSSGQWLRLI